MVASCPKFPVPSDAVYARGRRIGDGFFAVTVTSNQAGAPRLGLAVAVRAAGGAVARNRIRRLIRESFRLHQAGRGRMLRSLWLPASLPAMFAGFRISAGLSVVGEIVGGFFFQKGPTDLGILINSYVDELNTPVLFGSVIVSAILGVLVFWLFTGLGRLVYGRWKE